MLIFLVYILVGGFKNVSYIFLVDRFFFIFKLRYS